ncbi:carboxypeptidase-like regulatory domain-containing protein [Flavobacterium sp. SM2513]|uniref:carboxypeptidase-like regulatory domain-containing protein n=1 Tax=Flavobacterium sp. SM2513 TaxID=3424766 RepID=UPI003D7FD99D
MIEFYKKLLIVVVVFSLGTLHGQTLTGQIFDNETKESLPGATLYIDGTSFSTITDAEGNFRLPIHDSKATLVISFIGYLTYKLENPRQYVDKKLKILLVKESIALNEVVIGRGPFSRNQMMKVFRKQFLGESKAGRSCKIENEKDIVLYYDVSDNTLHASSRNPLQIQNKYLDYKINFDLEDFKVKYNFKTLDKFNQVSSYFSGTTFYKDLKKSKQADKRRRASFYGSAQHFAYTLANLAWEKEETRLFVEGFQVNPQDYFNVKDTLGLKKVTLIKEPQKENPSFNIKGNISGTSMKKQSQYIKTNFNILYKKDKQSVIEFVDKVFYVDANGNYNPIYGILYGGYIGTLKAGDLLPTDYFQTNKMEKKD